jgi:hypothetical protein
MPSTSHSLPLVDSSESLAEHISKMHESRETHLTRKHDFEEAILKLRNEHQTLQAASAASAQRVIELRDLEATRTALDKAGAEAEHRQKIVQADHAAVSSRRAAVLREAKGKESMCS